MAGFELAIRRGFLLQFSDGSGLVGYGDAPLLPRITGTEAHALEEALRNEGKNHPSQYIPPLPPQGGEGRVRGVTKEGLVREAIGDGQAGVVPSPSRPLVGPLPLPRAGEGKLQNSTVPSLNPNLPPEGRFGLATAKLDLKAKKTGVSLAKLLNPEAAGRVKVNAAIGAFDDGLEKRVAQAIEDGFLVLKLKTAILPWSEEGPRLARLIETLPKNVKLRLDANRGWSPKETPGILAKCANWPIEAIEEPCRYESFAELAALQSGLSFSLALDETLPHLDRREVLRACPTRRLIIKPAALGDLAETYDFASRAQSVGLEVTVTCAVDTAIGVRAALHLAAALDTKARFAHGLATSDWLQEDLAPPPLIAKGLIQLNEGPGLGVILHHAQA
jgi:L-alanine-DL-glutamate epimerase-like enolase superfamily enzyme